MLKFLLFFEEKLHLNLAARTQNAFVFRPLTMGLLARPHRQRLPALRDLIWQWIKREPNCL
jgi:hypothetical protein